MPRQSWQALHPQGAQALQMANDTPLPFDPKVFLATVTHGGRTLFPYRKDDVIFQQASPADSVFYIQTGKIKLTVASPSGGKEAVVAPLGPGDFFGEGCLNGQTLRLARRPGP